MFLPAMSTKSHFPLLSPTNVLLMPLIREGTFWKPFTMILILIYRIQENQSLSFYIATVNCPSRPLCLWGIQSLACCWRQRVFLSCPSPGRCASDSTHPLVSASWFWATSVFPTVFSCLPVVASALCSCHTEPAAWNLSRVHGSTMLLAFLCTALVSH